ncbi:MAG: hypothetical protein ACO3YU_01650 [Candidatus Nanopelagicales bacterium]
MIMSLYVVVSIGMALALTGLALALLQGRRRPHHQVLWVIALIVLGIDVALHVVVSVGSVVAGGLDGGWMVIGSAAIAVVLLTALIDPRIAGWTFAATGVLLPFVLVAADAMTAGTESAQISVGLMLAVYSSRAVLVGALLVLSATGDRPEEAPTVTGEMPIDESAAQLTGTRESRRR